MRNIKFVIEQEEPYEGRLSRTVPWEREGEIPSRDPTVVDGAEQCSLIIIAVAVVRGKALIK
jgi:hypothetical protein